MVVSRKRASHTWADIAFDAIYVGFIAGSVVGFYFLAIDFSNGHVFFTPSLMGQVLFQSADAHAIANVDLVMVAAFTVVHFFGFGLIGAAVSFTVHEVEIHLKHPAIDLAVMFLAFEAVILLVAPFIMPGVIAVVGSWNIAFSNLLAAGGITTFLMVEHHAKAWEDLKHAAHIV